MSVGVAQPAKVNWQDPKVQERELKKLQTLRMVAELTAKNKEEGEAEQPGDHEQTKINFFSADDQQKAQQEEGSRPPTMSSFKVQLARNAPIDKKRPKMDMTGINFFDDDPIRPDSKGTNQDHDFITQDVKQEDSFVERPRDWP